MIYIETDKDTNIITMYHYMPFDKEHGIKDEDGNVKTEEEMRKTGFLVDALPSVPCKKGYRAVLKYTKEKEFEYEYIEVPQNDYPSVPYNLVQQIQDDMTLALIESGVL